MSYLGDYLLGATVDFKWSSNDADGASITRSTDGTISVYKSNDTTQRTAEIADTEDFDSLTGVHHCSVMTTNDIFYTIGNDYQVVLSAATINAQTVNAVIAEFSIQNRSSSLSVANLANLASALSNYSATRGLSGTALPAVAAGSAGGLPDDTDSNGAVRIVDGTGAREINTNSGAVALVDLVTLTTENTDMVGTNSAALATVCTEGRLAELDSANLPTDIAAIPTTAMRGTDNAALATSVGFAGVGLTHLAQSSINTETRLAELDSANLPTDIDTLITRVPNTLNTTASGNIGIDWANIENPTTAQDLSATDIQLVDTVTTYTGNTKQTGDGYAIVNHASYGNDQLVRSTTPANALDVNATGEAGIDLDNTSGTLAKTTDITGFNDISTANVATELGTYDGTKRSESTSDKDEIMVRLGFAGVGLTHLAESSICTDTRLGELDSANIPSDIDSVVLGTVTNAQGANVATDVAGMIDGNSRVDVGSWIGTAVTLGSGAPDVNIASTDNIDLSATQKTSVNAEVDTALITTTYAEPGQGAPSATASIKDKLSYMYKFARNKITNDGNSIRVWDDAGTTVDQLSPVSSVGGTVTRGEFITGA